jgi:hypothetical protein
LFEKLGGPCTGQASEASGSRGGALKPVILVPDWHVALLFFAVDMQGNAGEGFVLCAGAEVTVPIIGAFNGRVVWGCLETLIAEDGFFEARVSVQGVAFVGRCLSWTVSNVVGRSLTHMDREGIGLVWLFVRGGFCEHLFNQLCGGFGMNKGAGGVHQHVVVALLLLS